MRMTPQHHKAEDEANNSKARNKNKMLKFGPEAILARRT